MTYFLKLFTYTLFLSIDISLAQLDKSCGFVPLCGSPATIFNVSDDFSLDFTLTSSHESSLLGGSVIEFNDCCNSKDTLPSSFCETFNPSGIHERTITSSAPLCQTLDLCQESCENKKITFKPVFIKSQSKSCCQSCSCYGDPVCNSFNDVEKTWILCDGREADDSVEGKCVFSRQMCEAQLDHAGNSCQFLAKHEYAKKWSSVQKGSPCVPNLISKASLIQMYSVGIPLDENRDMLNIFALNVEQGERGTINKVYLTLSTGLYTMTALDCLLDENPWKYVGDEVGIDLHSMFTRNEVVSKKNIGWRLRDPFTGISVDIKCFSNTYEPSKHKGQKDFVPKGGVHVPRINVEALTDPFKDTRPANSIGGFCVTDELDTGLATTSNTALIEENELCTVGHDNQNRLNVVRMMCNNPAVTASGEKECLASFCSKNFLPLFNSIDECISLVLNENSLPEGFCKAVLFSNDDVEECINHWKEMGGIVTVEQYLTSVDGCLKAKDLILFEGPTACQSGVSIQTDFEGEWTDFLFVPDNFCGTEELSFDTCEFPELLEGNIRFVQKSVDPSCEMASSCTKIDGFFTPIVVSFSSLNTTVSLRGAY